MEFSIIKKDKYTVLTVDQENLNTLAAPELKSEIIILHNAGTPNLILNLRHVRYVDSSGLSAILTADRLWKNNGFFILTEIKYDNVKKLLEISRLDTVLTIIPSEQEAVDYVLMEEVKKEIESSSDTDNGA